MVEKKIKNSKNIKKQQGIDINKLTTYFLTMILCAGFIFNGYFFERQILSVNIVVLAFLFYLVIVNGKKERYFYYNPWTIFLCSLFIIINFLGLCGAADLRAALDNFLLLASGVIIYLIVTQLETDSHKSLDYLKIMLKGIYWVSVFIAFVGLVSYIFGVNLLNSYQSDNRLISTLGYANTAALLFAMVFFTGFYLLENDKDKDRIYCFTNSLVILAFLGTKSRGVFLLFLFLIVLYFLLIKKENRPSFLKNFIYVFVPSLVVFPLFYNGTFISRDTKGIFLSSIAVLFLVMVAYLKKKVTFNTKKLLITGGIGLVIIFSFVFISVGHESVINAIADNDIIQRLKTINLEQQQVQERFIFVEDALKIVKDNLLLGTGGGGWKAEYRQYQTFLYHTSEVHNYYVQVLVENGILGFITYISFWVILMLNYFKKLKKERSFENVTIFTLVTAIFLHSFIDFDLSYPVFYLLWWVLLANSQETIVFKSIKVGPKKVWPAIIALFLLFFTNVSLWLGSAYGTEGIRYMQAKNIPKAIKSFETSTILDPVNPTYLTNLAQLYFIEESTQEKGLKIIDKSIKYNPTNFEWYIIKTKMMAETGNYREAYENALKAIQLAPWVEVAYYDTAKEFVDRVKEHPELSNYAMEILNMAREKTESIDPKYLPWWHGDLPYSDRIKGLEEKLSSL